MKKLFLVVLCFVFMAGSALAGAGGNAGATKDNPRQAGKSPIYFYDVECSDTPNPDCLKCKPCNGYGTFVIDTQKRTFNFIGHDYKPMSRIRVENFGVVIQGKATKTGNVHIQGSLPEAFTLPAPGTVGLSWGWYDPAFGFSGQNLGGYNCHLKIRYSTDDGATWHTTDTETKALSFGETYKIYIEDFADLPDHTEIQLKARVVGGDDTWTDDIWYYAKGGDPMFCFPDCDMHGPTWNASIDVYENNFCQYNLDSDYWYVWGDDVWYPPRD